MRRFAFPPHQQESNNATSNRNRIPSISELVIEKKCLGKRKKDGCRCGITSFTAMRNDLGQTVATPLTVGSDFCMFHLELFTTIPYVPSNTCCVVYIDLETTGLDIEKSNIVEIAAVTMEGECFSTVVLPPNNLLDAPPAVHGIQQTELDEGPTFSVALSRFTSFLAHVKMRTRRELLVVAHNGFNFDFPLLISEALRNRIDISALANYLYCDTLHVFRAVPAELHLDCVKLQCLRNRLCAPTSMQSHRAREDCMVLRDAIISISNNLSFGADRLLSVFAHSLDMSSTLAAMRYLTIRA